MDRRRPTRPLSQDVAEVLGYLDDLGYGELYLSQEEPPRSARPAPSGAPAARSEPSLPETSPRRGRESPQAARRPAPEEPSPDPALSPHPAHAGAPASEAPADRALALTELGRQSSACALCGLSEGRMQVVFGSGNPDADLMLVGEGPGAEEDRTGLPFVGRAGELLTRILKAIDLDREEVYIANIVKCRPPGNRDPQPEEVAACLPYLRRQIDLVHPRLLVALGRVAAQSLLGNAQSISRMRGQWHSFQGTPLRVTYHPAALLRYSTYKRPTWEDMQEVRDRLRELRETSS